MENLETRCLHDKATLVYTILQDQCSPPLNLSAYFTKFHDSNTNYNLSHLKTDLLLLRPKTNFLKCSFMCSVAMVYKNLSYHAKKTQSLPEFKSKHAFPFCQNALTFKFVCLLNSINLIVHLIILQKLTTNIVKLPVLCSYLPS